MASVEDDSDPDMQPLVESSSDGDVAPEDEETDSDSDVPSPPLLAPGVHPPVPYCRSDFIAWLQDRFVERPIPAISSTAVHAEFIHMAANSEQQIRDLDGRVASLQLDLQEGSEVDSIDESGSDDVGEDLQDSDFDNPHKVDDMAMEEKIRALEQLICPFFSQCAEVMRRDRTGPAWKGERLCGHCNLDLTQPSGKYGRESRGCAGHGFLCLTCAYAALQQQWRNRVRPPD